jgi:hypothetical protein
MTSTTASAPTRFSHRLRPASRSSGLERASGAAGRSIKESPSSALTFEVVLRANVSSVGLTFGALAADHGRCDERGPWALARCRVWRASLWWAAEMRRTLLWLAVAMLVLAAGGIVAIFALLPHGTFSALSTFVMISAFNLGCATLVGYGLVFHWTDRFRKSNNSLAAFIWGALGSVWLLFLAVQAFAAFPPAASPAQTVVLALTLLLTVGNVGWACLMYGQMLRDGGWRNAPPTL